MKVVRKIIVKEQDCRRGHWVEADVDFRGSMRTFIRELELEALFASPKLCSQKDSKAEPEETKV